LKKMESFQKYLLSKEGKDKKDKKDKKEKNGKILSFFSDLSLLQPPSAAPFGKILRLPHDEKFQLFQEFQIIPNVPNKSSEF
jgi:hypothetical protein